MAMLYYIGKNTTSSSAVSTTANTTQGSQGLNQSDTLRNVDDSSSPFAVVVVPVLIGLAVLVVVLVLVYKFRDNLRDRIHRNSQENRNNILDLTVKEGPDTSAGLNKADQDSNEDQANTSILPLMTQDNGV